MRLNRLFLASLLCSLTVAGCRHETRVDTVLDRKLVREQGRRVPSRDRATLQPEVQPDGSTILSVDWRPACRVREVEQRTVRTEVERSATGHLVGGGALVVGGGTGFVLGLKGMDRNGWAAAIFMVEGLASLLVGTGFVGAGAEYLMTTPDEKVHTETRPHGPWSTSECESPPPRVDLSFPGATLQAVLDEEGKAEFRIEPWMWNDNKGIIDAEVRINGRPSGRVRLVHPVWSIPPVTD